MLIPAWATAIARVLHATRVVPHDAALSALLGRNHTLCDPHELLIQCAREEEAFAALRGVESVHERCRKPTCRREEYRQRAFSVRTVHPTMRVARYGALELVENAPSHAACSSAAMLTRVLVPPSVCMCHVPYPHRVAWGEKKSGAVRAAVLRRGRTNYAALVARRDSRGVRWHSFHDGVREVGEEEAWQMLRSHTYLAAVE